ncbi:MAG: hypothetical protein ACRD5H_06915 [Nitrososphaerales archaeon]
MAEPLKYEATSFVDSSVIAKHFGLFDESFEYGLMLHPQFMKRCSYE